MFGYNELKAAIAKLSKRCCCNSLGTTTGAPTDAPAAGASTVRIDLATGILYYYDGDSWETFSSGPSYGSYVASITQSGTGAPVATVFENTLGGIPAWTRTGVGTYRLTLAGAFTNIWIGGMSQDLGGTYISGASGDRFIVYIYKVDNDTIEMVVVTDGFVPIEFSNGDAFGTNTFYFPEIRTY